MQEKLRTAVALSTASLVSLEITCTRWSFLAWLVKMNQQEGHRQKSARPYASSEKKRKSPERFFGHFHAELASPCMLSQWGKGGGGGNSIWPKNEKCSKWPENDPG